MGTTIPYGSRSLINSFELALISKPSPPPAGSLVLYADQSLGTMNALDSNGNNAGGGISVAKVFLTSSQIQNLLTNFVIVPAPGLGKVLMLLGMFFKYFFVTTRYTVAGGSEINAGIQGLQNYSIPQQGLFDQNANSEAIAAPSGGSFVASSSSVENLPITILATGGGVPSFGDGTLEVVALYQTITL